MTDDTIAAIATPPGCAALAMIRVSGPQALRVAESVLRRDGDDWPARQAVTAMAHDGTNDLDQVVAVYFPAQRSPTGEDLVELTCHGSPYIQKRLLAALLDSGARPARPGEFTQRAFIHGRLDLPKAEAVCDLIQAQTSLSHRAALSQLEGGLSQAVKELRAPAIELLARLEALLDHPDEDLPPLPAQEVAAILTCLAGEVERLAATFRTGRIHREGARVCIVGRPNAGKSSLLNALLGRRRAIVSPEPGTTRDTIEEPCDLSGLAAVLVDTAGLGHDGCAAADAESLERARAALRASDLALLVMDASLPESREDESAHRGVLEASAADGRPVIAVLNKTDLPRARQAPADVETWAVSALQGTGLNELKDALLRRLDAGPSAHAAAAVCSERHYRALLRCAAELREAIRIEGREELMARHLREALSSLDEITGPAAPNEILDEIFSRFCVGK